MTGSPAATLAKHELTEAERDVLTDIFTLAVAHSQESREKERELRAAIKLDPARWDRDGILGEHLWAVKHLSAAIAEAALARISVLAPIHEGDGRLLGLLGRGREAELERFLRPIFDEAGIGADFVA